MTDGEITNQAADRAKPVRDLAIGVDIGGTFTDCAVLARDGTTVTAKVLTTPHDRSEGFFAALDRAADKLGISTLELLARCYRLIHGTTTGTNAVVTRTGAKVGLITTAGHGDMFHLMKGGGRTAGLSADELLTVWSTDKPVPLVPRRLVFEVPERIDVDGEVVVAFDDDAARAAVSKLLEGGVDAVAVSFLWATRNGRHEQRMHEILAEDAPGVYVSKAASLTPRVGEFERTSAAVINAYIGPLMSEYVDQIDVSARQRGFSSEVLFAQCAGGAITSMEAREAPIRTLQSGPVSGVVGASFLAEQLGFPNVIATDVGGTSYDVAVVRDGLPLTRSTSVFERYEVALPMLDVESVGAGGGSIAWTDEAGRLQVGPQSAGADPGPACYARGGTQPTVTDADVVLGFIDPEQFLHGRLKLDRDRAESAIAPLAESLGLGLHEAAAGINRVVDSKMADLIRRMSVLRGFDPRDFVCFAYGGGGPVHVTAVARETGVRAVVVPLLNVAPVWSAFGAVVSDVLHVFEVQRVLDLPIAASVINDLFEDLERTARERLRHEGFTESRIRIRRRVRMRYAMQIHDIEVAVPDGELDDAGLDGLERSFERNYEALYGAGAGFPEGGIQMTSFAVHSVGVIDKPVLPRHRASQNGGEHRSRRRVYWDELGQFVDTPTVRLEAGVLGGELTGPALIDLPDTVIVVRPGQTAHSEKHGSVVIDL